MNKKIMKNGTTMLQQKKEVQKELEVLQTEYENIDNDFRADLALLSCVAHEQRRLRDLEHEKRSFKFLFCGKKEKRRINGIIRNLTQLVDVHDREFPDSSVIESHVYDLTEKTKEIARKEFVLESYKGYEDCVDFYQVIDAVKYAVQERTNALLMQLVAGENVIEFRGRLIEPSFEEFVPVVNIYLNNECIWGEDSRNIGSFLNEKLSIGKFENLDTAIRFLESEFDGVEVEVIC